MSAKALEGEFAAIVEAIAYNTWPHTSKAVTARKSHACVMAEDVSWFRACHPIRPGERYVRVAVFWPWSRAPLTAAVCDACADGSNLPTPTTEAKEAER